MHTNGIILTATRYRGKLNQLGRHLNYSKLSQNRNDGMGIISEIIVPSITNRRLLYSSNHLYTLNKWYTTTELKPGGTAILTEKEYYDMICDLNEEQRKSLVKALSLWDSQKVKGELEGGKNFFFCFCFCLFFFYYFNQKF